MSTFRVNTLQDASGSNETSTANLSQGRAKIWCNFNGGGTPAFRDSFGCASITDNGSGDFTINFSITMSNANYSAVSMGRRSDASVDATVSISRTTDPTTTALRIFCGNGAGAANDHDYICVAIFGD